MDIWDKKKRSAVMAKIKGKDTKPEWIVRRYLFSRGYRYRKNVKGLPGTPDIVLRKYGIVIFIHGCFWHGHEVDGHIPHSNSGYWQKKIGRNKQRDERDKAELKKMGWRVMTVWECQLKSAVKQQTLLEIEYHINHAYLEKFKPKKAKQYVIEKVVSNIAAEEAVEYKRDKSFIVKHDFLFNSRTFVQTMKNMRNIVDAIIEIVNAPQYRLKEYAESHNRANQMGTALEEYVKDLFAGTVNETDMNKRNQKISESFCYLGNQNNPPDSMLKNGGVAIEVKKIESPNSALALNSSYPKAKLYSDSEMINRACRFCEPWEVRDMLYVVGVLNGEVLTSLAFVYGDEYCADKEIYERIKKKLKEGILSIPNVEFADTKELGRVNRVDPLGITSLRIRGMWQIDNPFCCFLIIYIAVYSE